MSITVSVAIIRNTVQLAGASSSSSSGSSRPSVGLQISPSPLDSCHYLVCQFRQSHGSRRQRPPYSCPKPCLVLRIIQNL